MNLFIGMGTEVRCWDQTKHVFEITQSLQAVVCVMSSDKRKA